MSTLLCHFKRKQGGDVLVPVNKIHKVTGPLDHLPLAPAAKHRRPHTLYRDAQSVAFVTTNKCHAKRVCQICAISGCVTRASYTDLSGKCNTMCADHARASGTWLHRNACVMCTATGVKTGASFSDAEGRPDRLCADHARQAGVYECRNPCTMCLEVGIRTSSAYKDTAGKCKKLCADHARECGSWECSRPCTMCLDDGVQTQASFKDKAGNVNKLCAEHARECDSWECRHPCTMCLEVGVETEANFKDKAGNVNKLCADHAREHGSWERRRLCTMCLEVGVQTEASFKDAAGNSSKLCAGHARQCGSWECPRPCTMCLDAGVETHACFDDIAGRLRKLCARHAVQAGTHFATVPRASMTACRFFDRLSAQTGQEYPHVHFTHDGTIGAEISALIPGRQFRPDSYVPERKEVWLFHGNYWHGYPPGHDRHDYGVGHHDIPSSDLYIATATQMDIYHQAGYIVKYVWEHEYNETTRVKYPRPILDVVRAWVPTSGKLSVVA